MSLLLFVYMYIGLIVRFAKEFSTINKCINVFKHIHFMKKVRSFLVAILLLCAAMPGYSQLTFSNWEEYQIKWFNHGDEEETRGYDPPNGNPGDPNGSEAPLGSGIVVLTALGGAYLIGKKRVAKNDGDRWLLSLGLSKWVLTRF